jgi:hypothetical protein
VQIKYSTANGCNEASGQGIFAGVCFAVCKKALAHVAVSGSYKGTKAGGALGTNHAKSKLELCLSDVNTHDSEKNLLLGTSCCDANGQGSREGCVTGSYTDALNHCASVGKQLCSLDQLKNGAAESTGCQFDDKMVWSSTVCDLQAPTTSREVSATSGTVTEPFVSNGNYVDLPDDAGLSAQLCPANTSGGASCGANIVFLMQCTAGTTVTFKAEVVAPNGQADSFYIQLDAANKERWDTDIRTTWGWSAASPSLDASQGSHTVILHGREDGIKIRN